MTKVASSRFVSSTSCGIFLLYELERPGNQVYLFEFDVGEVRLVITCQ